MDRRTSRARRLDRVAERLWPRSGWPSFVLAEDDEHLERQRAELERLHGPRPEGHTLFVMTGVRRNRPKAEGGPADAGRGRGDYERGSA